MFTRKISTTHQICMKKQKLKDKWRWRMCFLPRNLFAFEMNTWRVCWGWPTNQRWHHTRFLFFVDFTSTVKVVDQFGFYVFYNYYKNLKCRTTVKKSMIWKMHSQIYLVAFIHYILLNMLHILNRKYRGPFYICITQGATSLNNSRNYCWEPKYSHERWLPLGRPFCKHHPQLLAGICYERHAIYVMNLLLNLLNPLSCFFTYFISR
jgi:hypothetical protein